MKNYINILILMLITMLYANSILADYHSCDAFIISSEKESAKINIPDVLYKQGLLWKITAPEGKTNYLFGTMHSQDYAVTKYPPQVRLALVKSKTLLMESIPNETSNKIFLEHMYFTDGAQLNALLEEEFYKRLTVIAADYGIPVEKINHLKPWAAFSIIGRPKPVRAPTLESNLYHFAQRNMIEIKPLETMEEIISSLEAISIDDQLIILKDTICNHTKIIQNTKKLVDLYVNRDLQGIVEFNHQPHYDESVFNRFMQHILYARNKRMLDRIEKEFRNGNVFVAVGASHLAEENGLLNQLNKKGYEITVIY